MTASERRGDPPAVPAPELHRPLRVLLVTRDTTTSAAGGDTIQFERTCHELGRLGVETRAAGHTSVTDGDVAWSDIVHVFNLQHAADAVHSLERARRAGRHTALSTVWWDLEHARFAELLGQLGCAPTPLTRPLKGAVDAAFRVLRRAKRTQERAALALADVLLPNSSEEARLLEAVAGHPLPNVHVVPNAVDPGTFPGCAGRPPGTRLQVVSAARIEATKNQLNVIHALGGVPALDLHLIGRPGRGHRYVRAVERAAARAGNVVLHAEHWPQDALAAFMTTCDVHVLASFRESPGLSTLEALQCGLRVVCAAEAHAPVGTYFGPLVGRQVFTCDPYAPTSIAAAVRAAAAAPVPPVWSAPGFTWPRAAHATLAAYHTALAARRTHNDAPCSTPQR